jgi:L-seryl-tRNA(Ser) seleniumtransferase
MGNMEELPVTLRQLPAIDRLVAAVEKQPEIAGFSHAIIVSVLRTLVDEVRSRLIKGQIFDSSLPALVAESKQRLLSLANPSLKKVVNATGVVLHTNLGRAPLGQRAVQAVYDVMAGYSTLEYNVATGERGSRYSHVAAKICALTGAEDAIVVNNNAAAVLLVLSALAGEREVIVSRGQLVEIGGSFRIPDVLRQSGATLVEVGATNKTHLGDYRDAISMNTALILKVHTSNYRIIGFTAQPDDGALVALAHDHKLPIIEDLGSGTLFSLNVDGCYEPTVGERLAAGVDLVTFSGDKLLGAGQAGIIAGKKYYIDKMRKHPLLRVIRIDKLSLAAIEGTLSEYLTGSMQAIPVWRMLHALPDELQRQAVKLASLLSDLPEGDWTVEIIPLESQAGGGALPGVGLKSYGVSVMVRGKSAATLESLFRGREIPIIVRIQAGKVIFDVRCLSDEDMSIIQEACRAIAERETA